MGKLGAAVKPEVGPAGRRRELAWLVGLVHSKGDEGRPGAERLIKRARGGVTWASEGSGCRP